MKILTGTERRGERWPCSNPAPRTSAFPRFSMPSWRVCTALRGALAVYADTRFSFYLITNPPCEVIDLAKVRKQMECVHNAMRPTFHAGAAQSMSREEVARFYPPCSGKCEECGAHVEVYSGAAHYQAIHGTPETATQLTARGREAVTQAMTGAKHGARTGNAS